MIVRLVSSSFQVTFVEHTFVEALLSDLYAHMHTLRGKVSDHRRLGRFDWEDGALVISPFCAFFRGVCPLLPQAQHQHPSE